MNWIIGHILAACIGLSLGLIGGGGSVLATPILVYIMGIEPKSAIVMTLVVVGVVSFIGAIPHAQRGNVNFKKAFMFGAATMLGAFIGAKIASLPFITGTLQMLLFAVMMLIAAIFMIRKNVTISSPTNNQPENLIYVQPICKYCWLWMLTEGLGVGIITGLVGVGGGFAIVPALVLLGNTPMPEAIGTSLLIIAFNSLAGFLGYFGQVPLDWGLMISFILAASFGTIIGSYLANYIHPQKLQKAFGYFLIAVSAFILLQNRNAFAKHHSQTNFHRRELQSKNIKYPDFYHFE